jgi:hypothetical protein
MLIYQPSERTNAVEALKHAYLHSADQDKQEETSKEEKEDSKPSATATTTESEKTQEPPKTEETTETKVDLSSIPPSANQSPPKRRSH